MLGFIRHAQPGDFAWLAQTERMYGRPDDIFVTLQKMSESGTLFGYTLIDGAGEPQAFAVATRVGHTAVIQELYGSPKTIKVCLEHLETLAALSFGNITCTVDETRDDTIQLLKEQGYKALKLLRNKDDIPDDILFAKILGETNAVPDQGQRTEGAVSGGSPEGHGSGEGQV